MEEQHEDTQSRSLYRSRLILPIYTHTLATRNSTILNDSDQFTRVSNYWFKGQQYDASRAKVSLAILNESLLNYWIINRFILCFLEIFNEIYKPCLRAVSRLLEKQRSSQPQLLTSHVFISAFAALPEMTSKCRKMP